MMYQAGENFEHELQVDSRWLEGLPLVLGLCAVLVGTVIPESDLRLNLQLLGIGMSIASPLPWILRRWRDWLGKVSTLILLVLSILFLSEWSATPALLSLLAIFPGLAILTLSVGPGVIAAGTETVLLLFLSGDWLSKVSAVVMIWAMVGLMTAVQNAASGTAGWAWRFYQQALDLRQTAFAQKESLQKTMQDLENANRQLASASKRMAALRALAEEAQRTKTMFLAKVSHEFRTPLNMIIGLVELMVASPQIYAIELPPEMESDLRVIHRNCKHLSGMVNDVLDLTRVESDRVILHREWVSLAEIIHEAVTAVRPLVDKKGLTLDIELPDDLPDIYCDRTRIRQVVLNLVSNAARFTDRGGITVETQVRDDGVVTCVRDTGRGIAPHDIDHIFEPFSQGGERIWRNSGGSGLGLSISQHFIKLHYGNLWVESELDVGSNFYFELPISEPMEPFGRPGHYINPEWVWREAAFRTEGAGIAKQVRKPRIVCYDENAYLCQEFSRYTDEVDFDRIEDPLALKEELSCAVPDILVLNRNDSAEIFAELEGLQESVLSGTLVVDCSVSAPVARTAELGAAGYLTKPVSREDLESILQEVERPVRRVLIVDDDPEVQKLFARMIRLTNVELDVEVASNGKEALEKVRMTPFDVVLLDVVMPEMDGWEWLQQVSYEPNLSDLSVYLVSAQDPVDNLPVSSYLAAKMVHGLSVKQLLRCSLELSRLLLTPQAELDPVPRQIDGEGTASEEKP